MTADKEGSAARLSVNGKELTLPMVEGTDGEGAIDVSRLRAETGLVAFDPGYGNTADERSARPPPYRITSAIALMRSPASDVTTVAPTMRPFR